MIGWIIGGVITCLIVYEHHLEKKEVQRFHNRWSYGRRLWSSNECLENGISSNLRGSAEYRYGKKLVKAFISGRKMTAKQKKDIKWKKYRENCGELGPGACYISPHDFGHWRGRIFAFIGIWKMRMNMKWYWTRKLEYDIGQFIKPIRYEKSGDVTKGYRFMPWTKKVTGHHSGMDKK